MKKILQVRFIADKPSQTNIAEQYSANIKKGNSLVFRERNKYLLKHILINIIKICSVTILFMIPFYDKNAGVLQNVIFAIIGTVVFRWAYMGLIHLSISIYKRFYKINRADTKKVVKEYYKELNSGLPDWGKICSLQIPTELDALSQKVKAEWQKLNGKKKYNRLVVYPEGNFREAVRHVLNSLRTRVYCSSCGTEHDAFKTYYWRFSRSNEPFDLVLCPKCNTINCSDCLGKQPDYECSHCNYKLRHASTLRYFKQNPSIAIIKNNIPNKNLSQHIAITQDISDTIKKIEFRWQCTIECDSQDNWKKLGRISNLEDVRVYSTNVFEGVLIIENYCVKIDDKWYLTEPIASENCEVECIEMEDTEQKAS